jgi:hypothetical protein
MRGDRTLRQSKSAQLCSPSSVSAQSQTNRNIARLIAHSIRELRRLDRGDSTVEHTILVRKLCWQRWNRTGIGSPDGIDAWRDRLAVPLAYLKRHCWEKGLMRLAWLIYPTNSGLTNLRVGKPEPFMWLGP